MKIGYKIWLDHAGKAFGEGPYELLIRVKKTKSLHQAARQMGMSYSKAWHLIRSLEEKLGFILLERRAGGLSGGGSQITPMAEDLMRHYERFREEVKMSLERIFQRHFGSMAKKIRS